MGDVDLKKGVVNSSVRSGGKDIRFLEPEVVERKNFYLKNAGIAVGLAMGLVFVQFLAMTIFSLDAIASWIVAFCLMFFYGVLLYFFLESGKVREISQPIVETEIQSVEKPVVKESVRTINKEVIKEVPVYRDVTKTIYVAQPEKKSLKNKKDTLAYDFVGSKLTKVYHLSSCRLSKSIKAEYRIKGPTRAFFKRMRYRPCKVCLKNSKRL